MELGKQAQIHISRYSVSQLLDNYCCTPLSAAGLYYLAELVEEYTVMTARIIRWVSLFTLVAYVGLFLFEGFTASMVICGVIAQLINLFLLQVRSIILSWGKIRGGFLFLPKQC